MKTLLPFAFPDSLVQKLLLEKLQFFVLLLPMFLQSGSMVMARDYTLKTGSVGSAQTASSWNTDGSGAGEGSNASSFTFSGDKFIILSTQTAIFGSSVTFGFGVTLQVDGSISVSGGSSGKNTITINGTVLLDKASTGNQVTLSRSNNGSAFTIGATGILKTKNPTGVSGLNCALPATVVNATVTLPTNADYEFNGITNQGTLGLPTTVNNLSINNIGTTNNTVTLTGNTTVTNDLTITSGTLDVSEGNFGLNVKGNWINNASNTAFNCRTSTVTFSGSTQAINGSSYTTFYTLAIAAGSSTTMTVDNACFNLIFTSNSSDTGAVLTHIGSSVLTINGVVIINQPKSINVTNAWNINAGSATVSGLITFGGSSPTATQIGKIRITTGTLNANGGITFSTINSACHVIDMSTGNGTLNLKGILTVPPNSSTLTAGTSGSIFNYTDSKPQTINFFSAGAYNNLLINNTSCALLSGAITPSNVTGNIFVGSMNPGSIFSSNNNTITLATSKSLTVEIGSILNAGTSIISFSTSGVATINGTFKTENTSGFSGKTGTAISSTNSPLITLGTGSTIEYTALTEGQTVTGRTYNNLTLSGSGTRTIDYNSAVSVNGALVTNGLLTINSVETNSGSLIIGSNGTSSGNVTYNRWLGHTGSTYSRWYITSAPVNVSSGFDVAKYYGTITNSSKIHKDGSLFDFASYNEMANEWTYATAIPSGLIAGKGYLFSLKPSTDGMIQFTGTLNNGNVTPSVANSGISNGWNAIGNPYTSAINVVGATGSNSFLEVNKDVLDPSFAATYVWNETAGYDETQQYYRVIGNAGYDPHATGITLLQNVNNIQAGQGFLVKANRDGAVLFTKAMQVHDTDIDLKSSKVSWHGITLLAKSHGQTRSTAVAFNDQMTKGLDVTYDAGLLASDCFHVYSHLVSGSNAVDFAIQCLPEDPYNQIVVPVGIDLPEGGDLVFKTSGVILPDGLFPVIEDKLLNIKTALKTEADSYKVNLSKNTSGTGRFYLTVEGLATLKPTVEVQNKFTASIINNRLVINGAVDAGTKALLFDIRGRKVGEYPLLDLNRNELFVSGLNQRVYLLKIVGRNYSQTHKLVNIR